MPSAADTLERVTDVLAAAGVPYMIVGSVASSLHGVSRTTEDVDIAIDPSSEQLEDLVQRLERYDFYVSADAAREALRTRKQFNVIDQLTIEKVDLALRRDTPFGREAFGRRVKVLIGEIEVFVTTPEDVILAKLDWARRSGSERQLRDVAGVLRVQAGDLDVDYIRDWAEEMALTDALDRARRLADDSDS